MELEEAFEAQRPRLRAVAQRMLGPGGEADDAVQEAWLRLARTDAETVDNLAAWLTTVVSRICLDVLRARASRREIPVPPRSDLPGLPDLPDLSPGPEDAAELADSVGVALTVVLDTLSPNERLAFVLHDMFGVGFDEIALMIEASPAATRQYASMNHRNGGHSPRQPFI